MHTIITKSELHPRNIRLEFTTVDWYMCVGTSMNPSLPITQLYRNKNAAGKIHATAKKAGKIYNPTHTYKHITKTLLLSKLPI